MADNLTATHWVLQKGKSITRAQAFTDLTSAETYASNQSIAYPGNVYLILTSLGSYTASVGTPVFTAA